MLKNHSSTLAETCREAVANINDDTDRVKLSTVSVSNKISEIGSKYSHDYPRSGTAGMASTNVGESEVRFKTLIRSQCVDVISSPDTKNEPL
jgi:hypothetical protein